MGCGTSKEFPWSPCAHKRPFSLIALPNSWDWETVFTCPHTIKFWTRPLASTASGMASDSVRGRGGGGGGEMVGLNLEVSPQWGLGFINVKESAKTDV